MTLGPFHQANKHGLPKKLLTIAIVAALMFRNGDDEQANKCIKMSKALQRSLLISRVGLMTTGSNNYIRLHQRKKEMCQIMSPMC